MGETLSSDSLSGTPLNNLTDLYNSFEFNLNNFPRSAMAGGDTIPVIHGLVGAIDIPSNTLSTNSHSGGVAGYARTASNVPAVGVYGAGLAAANNTNIWGGNFIASNTHSQPFPGQTGYQGCTVHGIEVDVCIVPLAGGSAPNAPTRGFYSVNGSVVVPNGDFNAFDAASIDSETDTRWNVAYNSGIGAAQIALDAWPILPGNSQPSQPIYLRGSNSSGVIKIARLQADMSGNLHMNPGDPNSSVILETSGGTTRVQATNTGVDLFGSVTVNGTAIEALVPSGGWADFTPTFGGFSSNPATTGCRYKRYGNTVTVNYDCWFGTSNSSNLTCTLPVASVNTGASYVRDIICRVRDNGNCYVGLIEFDNNASQFTVYKDVAGSGFTSSGGKGFRVSFTYECAP